MRVGILWAVCILAIFYDGAAVWSQPSRTEIARASRSAVKIFGRDCSDTNGNRIGNSVASGFVWPAAGQAVTALHAVAGCDRIIVHFNEQNVDRRATVEKLSRTSDLALLRVQNAPSTSVMPVSSVAPAVNEIVVSLGYDLDSPTLVDKAHRVAYGQGANRLRDLLNDQLRQEILRAGLPDLDLEITRLDGQLVAGASGGAIINSNGELIGIADGGLERGAASISWAIPFVELNNLLASRQQSSRSVAAQSELLFASDREVRVKHAVICGGLSLKKLRTRRFQEVAASTDDVMGLNQIVAMIQSYGIDPNPLRFDLYDVENNGATIAVPEGMELVQDQTFCRGEEVPGQRLYVQSRSVNNQMQLQIASSQFENQLQQTLPPLIWQPNATLTYRFGPQYRALDNMVVNRKSYVGMLPTNMYISDAFVFETLLGRGTNFTGVVAANLNQRNPMNNSFAHIRSWSSMLLSVALSTYTIN